MADYELESYTLFKSTLKRAFPFTRPMRGVLGEGGRWGGPQRGGPSWRSSQMIPPPLQLHPSRSPHEEQGQWLGDKASSMPRKWRGSGRGNWGARKQDPQKNTISTAHSHRRRPRRHRTAPRNQTGSRQRAAWPTRSAGHAEHDGTWPKRKKREHRDAKRRRDQKIKARAWRNKRNKNKRSTKDKDQAQEVNQNKKDKARSWLRRSHSAIEPRLSLSHAMLHDKYAQNPPPGLWPPIDYSAGGNGECLKHLPV